MTDQLQSNVLTVGPDGEIGALFPGGVQIPVSTSAPNLLPETHAVTFVRDSDGAAIAQIFTEEIAGVTDTTQIRSNLTTIPGDSANRREIDLVAQSPDGQNRAFVIVATENTGGPNGQTITLGVGPAGSPLQPKLIDDRGRSNWLQLLSTQKLQLVRGYFDGRSGPPTIVSGSDYTVAKAGAGAYTVTFSTAFATFPGLGLATGIVGDNVVRLTANNAGSFSVQVETRAGGAAADDFVSFTAIG